MATIRVTDPSVCERDTYLTPADAQHILLSFDQGWPIPTRKLTIRRAVHVGLSRVGGDVPNKMTRREQQQARVADLERREAAGEPLTTSDRRALKASRGARARRQNKDAPTSPGPKEVVIIDERPVVVGGKPPVTGAAHPNLLRGRNRHYERRLADPGEAFRNAVEQAVQARSWLHHLPARDRQRQTEG